MARLAELKAIIRSILNSYDEFNQPTRYRVEKDFLETEQEPFETVLNEFNTTFDGFIRMIPDVARLVHTSRGTVVQYVPNEKSAHLLNLTKAKPKGSYNNLRSNVKPYASIRPRNDRSYSSFHRVDQHKGAIRKPLLKLDKVNRAPTTLYSQRKPAQALKTVVKLPKSKQAAEKKDPVVFGVRANLPIVIYKDGSESTVKDKNQDPRKQPSSLTPKKTAHSVPLLDQLSFHPSEVKPQLDVKRETIRMRYLNSQIAIISHLKSWEASQRKLFGCKNSLTRAKNLLKVRNERNLFTKEQEVLFRQTNLQLSQTMKNLIDRKKDETRKKLAELEQMCKKDLSSYDNKKLMKKDKEGFNFNIWESSDATVNSLELKFEQKYNDEGFKVYKLRRQV